MAAAAVTAADRIGLTLFLAAAAHGLVILGVGFAPEERAPDPPRALDVVLLQQRTEEAPETADYLSNVDAAGGGTTKRPSRPRAPVSSSEPSARAGLAPMPLEAGAPQPRPATPRPLLTQRAADRSRVTSERQPEQTTTQHRRQPTPIDYSARIARLAQEIDNALRQYAQRPRKMFVTASTRRSVAAAYMHGWVESVERIGNVNYPDAVRERELSGSLVLAVAVRADGSLVEVAVRASSGRQVLDEAAMRIVRLAAPFAPFPEALRKKTDILYITRTWEFSSGDGLDTH